jgi:hypothetical protein
MKVFALTACIFILLSPATGMAAPAAPPPLRFEKTPLGNAVRMIAPRLGAIVSIAANATAPVSGDFSKLDPKAALTEAARQAGLVVIPGGTKAAPEFFLVKPSATASVISPSPNGPDAAHKALAEADRQRAELLRKRASLLAEESQLP